MSKTFRLVFIIIICLASKAYGQKPNIVSVDRSSQSLNGLVTIAGSNFGSSPAEVVVFFGAAQAELIEVSNQLIVAKCPAGATFDNITVTNLSNGLTGFSEHPFFINYGGEVNGTTSFGTQSDFDATKGLYDLCLCDFDNDGKTDVLSASEGSNSFAVFHNGSDPGAVAFTPQSKLLNAKTTHSTCGDLNGDGLAEIILSESSDNNRIFVYKNSGGFNFSAPVVFTVPGRKVKHVAIADLDLDGKPDLVVTDKTTNSNGFVLLRNLTNGSSISFSAPITVSIPAALSTDALQIKDVDGDELPEILVSEFLLSPTKIFVCKNNSTPGNLDFSEVTQLNLPGPVVNIKVADLDDDGKPEILAARLLNEDIAIFKNQTNGSQIQFANPISVAVNSGAWGIDLGDLNGDGKLDFVVASINAKSIRYFENQSNSGTINFKPAMIIPTNYINRNIRIGDVDRDGKPDLVFTSIDDNTLSIESSKISVIRNTSCFVPAVLPEGPHIICAGLELELTSSESAGVTYEWERNDAVIPGAISTNFIVDQTGVYTITATSIVDACSKTSAVVSVTVVPPGAGLSADDAHATSNSPVCSGQELQLSADDVGATVYKWKRADGNSVGTGRTLSISDFDIEDAGIYILEMFSGACVAKIDSTLVEVVSNPDFNVSFSGSEFFCEGDAKTLSITPILTAGFAYQWFSEDDGQLNGETGLTLSASSSGTYYAQIISDFPGCPPVETPKVQITSLVIPVANFNASVTEACAGQQINFVSASTSDPSVSASFDWNFGDQVTASGEDVSHAFATSGTFQVTLTISYEGGICADEHELPVTISQGPNIFITAPNNIFKVCENDTLRLGVGGDTFSSFIWSTGSTEPTTLIEGGGTYSVTVVTSNGCTLEAEKIIQETPTSEVIVLAESQPIAQGDFVEINSGESVRLTASGGLSNIIWRPGFSLSDSTTANTIATPLQDVLYTVKGKDVNGCTVQGSIMIKVLGSSPLELIKPKKYFSPNGDSENQFWTIDNILSFPQCTVTIYNDKGAKVFEAKPYNNDWDGTMKGRELPAGVYYYVIQCDGTDDRKTGPITLLK